MSWFSNFFNSSVARAVTRLALELSVMSLDNRVVRPLLVGLGAARQAADELGLEREKRFLGKLHRYMGEPEIPEE